MGVRVQAWDWQERSRKLVWKLRTVAGGSERTLRIRATLEDGLGAAGVRRGVGPVSLQFTIPMHCVSRLQARPWRSPACFGPGLFRSMACLHRACLRCERLREALLCLCARRQPVVYHLRCVAPGPLDAFPVHPTWATCTTCLLHCRCTVDLAVACNVTSARAACCPQARPAHAGFIYNRCMFASMQHVSVGCLLVLLDHAWAMRNMPGTAKSIDASKVGCYSTHIACRGSHLHELYHCSAQKAANCAGAVPADPKARQELPAIPMGAVCHALQLLCCADMKMGCAAVLCQFVHQAEWSPLAWRGL